MAIPATPDISAMPTPPKQAVALFIIVFFTALAFIAFSLRVWTRLRVTRQWGIDDTLMVPAELCSILMAAPFYLYAKLGYFGWHKEDVPEDFDPSPGLWWFYLSQIFYNPILALVKCSVLVFILRVGGLRSGVRWACFGLITFTALQAVAIFFAVLLQCVPIEANWDMAARADAKCINVAFHVTISSITILTDILVVALPFYVFLGLKMRRATKIAVICVFALGGVVTVVGIVRIWGVIQLFYYPDPNGDTFYDIKMVLSVVEVNTAIVTACAPVLRPLLRHFFPSLFSVASEDDYYHKHGASGGDGTANNPYGQGSGRNFSKKMYGSNDMSRTRSHRQNPHGGGGGIAMKPLRGFDSAQHSGHVEVRGSTPTGSDEAIMTYNGIMRTMDVKVQYEDTEPLRRQKTETGVDGGRRPRGSFD
ncbi:integral membrane protein PTH11 [Apiospora kogelbergensis]|uniref:Integral membrane protein PTH11 n=1 Tax=Apiospora kogelbergensis TaxID=1337665 RepID=A0AAW0QR43_9PEZI